MVKPPLRLSRLLVQNLSRCSTSSLLDIMNPQTSSISGSASIWRRAAVMRPWVCGLIEERNRIVRDRRNWAPLLS